MTPRRRAGALWATAWALAALVCTLGGWTFVHVRGDGDLRYAKARDAALGDGRRDIAALTTVDSGHLGRDLGTWLAVTTGPLHDTLARTHTADETSLRRSGASTRGTVTDAAVTELDTRAGTARLIATAEVRTTPRTGAPATDRKRFEATLARTPRGWKLTALTAVPAGGAS
ncbi:hypothetical protein [Streptomyces sp. HPF1205]|uniref:hypothetical protein n=1 Tax=Streptomyces sp. HPF1205 TaxID=2873262 RepID=UPI001CEDB7EF|nr:hypothetical protein [Streptomyces sp. HPF1205]